MKAIDRYLQHVRINKAKKYIRKNDRLLDIGTADGVIFRKLRGLYITGTGIDPLLPDKVETDFYTLLIGCFPDECPDDKTYDVITMLAVLEHIPGDVQSGLAVKCFHLLNEKGRIIITVPSPKVDKILRVLTQLKLTDGMSVEEHYGFKPVETIQIFAGEYFKLIHKEMFEFGLNNLFVFEKL
jgi:2-polyprenyl-3-methyl-5-hydroxy-6-metoxy-1,4-benzoquinol methylase